MRVLVLHRRSLVGVWYPYGDFEVVSETLTFYKVKTKVRVLLGKEVIKEQWVPKFGSYTYCEKLKGWYV